jgi:signal transduction histidine kinase
MRDENEIPEIGDDLLSPVAAARVAELVDSVNQTLYSLTLHAAGRRMMAERGGMDAERAADGFKLLGDLGRQALTEIRLLVHLMRSPSPGELGLVKALQLRLDMAEHWVYEEARLSTEGEVHHLPRVVEQALFRIAQEALNNTLRHAHATAVTVRLWAADDRVNLSVNDNGVGFEPSASAAGSGLVTMRELAAAVDGALTINSAPKQGTTVEVSVTAEPGEGHY